MAESPRPGLPGAPPAAWQPLSHRGLDLPRQCCLPEDPGRAGEAEGALPAPHILLLPLGLLLASLSLLSPTFQSTERGSNGSQALG